MTVWGKFSFNFDNKIKVDWSVSCGGGRKVLKLERNWGTSLVTGTGSVRDLIFNSLKLTSALFNEHKSSLSVGSS